MSVVFFCKVMHLAKHKTMFAGSYPFLKQNLFMGSLNPLLLRIAKGSSLFLILCCWWSRSCYKFDSQRCRSAQKCFKGIFFPQAAFCRMQFLCADTDFYKSIISLLSALIYIQFACNFLPSLEGSRIFFFFKTSMFDVKSCVLDLHIWRRLFCAPFYWQQRFEVIAAIVKENGTKNKLLLL